MRKTTENYIQPENPPLSVKEEEGEDKLGFLKWSLKTFVVSIAKTYETYSRYCFIL